MKLKSALVLPAVLLAGIPSFFHAEPAMAQGHSPPNFPKPSETATAPVAPYAGIQNRAAKSLSDAQIADFNAGRGMGMALPAELNGYPGPSHVLDLAAELSLSEQQREEATRLLEAMKAKTIPIGQRIMREETGLDRSFAENTVTRETLADTSARIALLQGELRAAHLTYHLDMRALLLPAQAARYAQLRGYSQSRHDQHMALP